MSIHFLSKMFVSGNLQPGEHEENITNKDNG